MTNLHKKQLIAGGILAIINLLLSRFVVGNGRQLDGQSVAAGSAEMQRATIITLFFGVQMFSFIIGALVALIPYKGQQYTAKWVAASLGIAVLIQAALLFMGVVKLFLR